MIWALLVLKKMLKVERKRSVVIFKFLKNTLLDRG